MRAGEEPSRLALPGITLPLPANFGAAPFAHSDSCFPLPCARRPCSFAVVGPASSALQNPLPLKKMHSWLRDSRRAILRCSLERRHCPLCGFAHRWSVIGIEHPGAFTLLNMGSEFTQDLYRQGGSADLRLVQPEGQPQLFDERVRGILLVPHHDHIPVFLLVQLMHQDLKRGC